MLLTKIFYSTQKEDFHFRCIVWTPNSTRNLESLKEAELRKRGAVFGFIKPCRMFGTPCSAQEKYKPSSAGHLQMQLLAWWYPNNSTDFATCSEMKLAGFPEETIWYSCTGQKGSWASFSIL